MKNRLALEAVAKFTLGVVLTGVLVFVPAGSLHFTNGWLFLGLLFLPMLLAGLFMLKKSPDLLKKRLDAKEKQKGQSRVVKFSGLMFLAGFTVAGLNFRFRWHVLPGAVVVCAAAVFLGAYLLYAQVLRKNRYLSRTIEVQEGQTVIETGPYAVVRHPMYSATVLLFLSMPLILGSIYAFFVFLAYIPIIVSRILQEEAFLLQTLPGYGAYCKKVKYRLIPLIW